MAKKFLSFLGGGNYSECVYKCLDLPKGVNSGFKTRFIQEALLQLLCKDWNENDKAIIFLTEFARKQNWESGEKLDKRTGKKEYREGLENELKKHSNTHFQIVDIDIKDGNNMDEIWSNFDIIINQIDNGDEIIFDITHAFRYIPMLALVVLNYVKVLKDVKIIGIYYGNYEYNNEAYDNPELKKGQKPIMNLIQLDEILGWSQAVNSFVKYGISDHIYSFANEILNSKNNKAYYKENKEDIKELVKSLDDFTKSIQTCRGRVAEKSDETNSIFKAYEKLDENLNKFLENKSNNTLKPLVHITGKIEETMSAFKPVDHREEVINTGLGVVKWSLDNNLIQQAFTALLETMISYMCILLDLKDVGGYAAYHDIKQREIASEKINKKYNEYKFRAKNNKDIRFKDNQEELSVIISKLKIIRNDINHYGYCYYGEKFLDKPSRSYQQLTEIISQSYEEFVRFLKKVEGSSI